MFRLSNPPLGGQYLASGLATRTSLSARSRLPVAHGPESRHYTPVATNVLYEHFNGNSIGVSRAGVGTDCQDRERQGSRDRAYKDVLVASPGSQYPSQLPTSPVDYVGQCLRYLSNFFSL